MASSTSQIGRTIQIYLPSGEPRGVRIAEFTTRIVQAVVVPRSKLDEAVQRTELAGVGVYFLFGQPDDSERMHVYIGETENCFRRLKEHNVDPKMDFWQISVTITSKTQSFTKVHVRLLEWMSISRAMEVDRFDLRNGNAGIEPKAPEPMRADGLEIFDTMDVLLSALGFPIFEPTHEPATGANIFQCTTSGASARGIYTEDGFVVLEGSIARQEIVPSSQQILAPKRRRLVDDGLLEEVEQGYRFTKDHVFRSPSAAGDMVTGSSVNGWDVWIDQKGRTLHEVYRQSNAT